VSVAVDGETFGHHEPFGDMCIAALVTHKARPRGFHLTNYGEFLAEVPPTHEVELQTGDHGEGTAWSCAHGVGRWTRDCGCSTGAPAGWNQSWRQPLRDAFDGLRDAVATAFERRGREIFHDPWAARDDYIDLVVRPDEASVAEGFFARHLKAQPDHANRVEARKLLEAQRHGMAMYTSCAWFFSDVTGIETIQNIRYAARCAQIMQEFSEDDLEGRLLTALEHARSNNGRDTGANLYRRIVTPEVRTVRRAANAYAIFRLLEVEAGRRRVYNFTLRDAEEEDIQLLGHRGRRGHLWLRDRRSCEENEISYLAIEYSPRNLRCFLTAADSDLHQRLRQEVDGLRPPLERADLERSLTALYGGPPLGIGDLLPQERRRIAERLAAGRVGGLRQEYRAILKDNLHLLEDFADMQLDLPQEIRVPCEFTLQLDLQELAQRLEPPFAPAALEELEALVARARRLTLAIDLKPVADRLSQLLRGEMQALLEDRQLQHFEAAGNLLGAGERLRIELRRAEAEELLYEFLLRQVVPQFERGAALEPAEVLFHEAALRFAERLNFAVDDWRTRLHAAAAPAAERSA
jgi:hypothetical protein